MSSMQGESSNQQFNKIILDTLLQMDGKVNLLSQEVSNLNGQIIRLTNENKQMRGWLQQAPRI